MKPEVGRFGAWVGMFSGQPIAEVRDGARQLEAAGYSVLWYGEAIGRESLSFGAILLSATESIVVASGIANIYARDATAMKNGGRTLAEAFPGRFVLGIGVSHPGLVQRRGHDYASPYRTLVGYLDAFDAAESRVPGSAGDPPVVLAALGPKMLRLAAARTAGTHPYFVPVAHTLHARETMGSQAWLAPEQAAVLTDDVDLGKAVARKHMGGYLKTPAYRSNLLRMGWLESDLDAAPDELVDAIVVVGDEAAIARRLHDHLDAGADHASVQILPHEGAKVPIESYLRLAQTLKLGT